MATVAETLRTSTAWREAPATAGPWPTVAGIVNAGLAVGLLVVLGAWTNSIPALPRGDLPAGLYVAWAVALGIAVLVLNGMAFGEAYFATLWATLPFLPMVASIAVVAVYLAIPSGVALHEDALLFGIVIAAAGWVTSAGPLRGLASADIAQSRSFEDLRDRTRALDDLVAARFGDVAAQGRVDEPGTGSDADLRRELLGQLDILKGELGLNGSTPPGAGIRYVSANGYINLWRTLHRAEGLLIEIEDEKEVFAAAVYDDLRLIGSRIPNTAALRNLLRQAADALDHAWAVRYFAAFEAGKEKGPLAAEATAAPGPTSASPGGSGTPSAASASDQWVTSATPAATAEHRRRSADALEARRIVGEVRRSVNEYRDGLWEGLVRQRNRLLRTVIVTATAGLLVIGLAVSMKVPRDAIAAGTAYFLVGAAVGLFIRLRTEGEARSAIDDYGLFEARLMQTPILSGLAGVAGVCLTALLPAAAAGAQEVTLPQLFDLSKNAQPLLTAAVFGMAPELVVQSLGNKVKEISDSLTASQASGGPSAAGSSTSTPSQTGAGS